MTSSSPSDETRIVDLTAHRDPLESGGTKPIDPSVTNDEIQRFNALDDDERPAEAERLGLVLTHRGVFANPDHPARKFCSLDEAEAEVADMFERHDTNWKPGTGDTFAVEA